MSRKDPRRRMVIPLTPTERAFLRRRAGTGSLGDQLRRIVQDELRQGLETAEPATQLLVGATAHGLPLQLPRRILAQLDDIARQGAVSVPQLVRLALIRSQSR